MQKWAPGESSDGYRYRWPRVRGGDSWHTYCIYMRQWKLINIVANRIAQTTREELIWVSSPSGFSIILQPKP